MGDLANNASSEEATDFDCSRLVRRICEHKVLLAGCVGFFLLAGLAYLAVVPKLYQATTIIELDKPGTDIVDREQGEVGEVGLKTAEQNLCRISIYRRVVARDDFRGVLFSGEPDEAAFQQEAERLAGRTRVRWQRGTSLIFVTVTDGDREMAEQLAAAIVKEFAMDQVEKNRARVELRLEALARVSASLQKRMRDHREMGEEIHGWGVEGAGEVKRKLGLQEQELADFSRGKGEDAPGLVQSQKRLDAYRDQLRRSLAQIEALVKKGGEFWEGLNLDQLSDLAEEKRMEVILNFVQGRAEVLGLEADSERRLLASLMGEIKELELLVQIEEPGIRVVEPAFVLPDTAGPGRSLILIVAMFLGLAVGLLLVWGKSICQTNDGEK